MSGNRELFQSAMNQGHSAAWDQMWEQAAEYYRQALAEFPDNPTALTSLGMALLELQSLAEALRCYQRAAQLTPEDPLPLQKMARIYERQGSLPEAVQVCLKAAELYLKGRDIERAIENWLRVIRLQPDHLTARTRLALIYERLGRKQEAVGEYLAIASLMQQSGSAPQARQAVEYALKLLPDSKEARQALELLQKGRPLPKPPRPPGATGPVRMAEVRQLESAPGGENIPLEPVAEARQKALVELASLLFEEGETNGTADLSERRGLAALARGAGGQTGGKADQTRILLHLGQAIDAQTKGEDNQAAEELGRAIESGLDHSAAYFNLGLLLAQRNHKNALRYLQKALKHPGFSLAANLLIGGIYLSSNDYTQAATAYLQALRLADASTVPDELADELGQLYEPVIEAQRQQTDLAHLKTLSESIAGLLQRADWREQLKTARQQLPAVPGGGPPLPLAEMLLQTGSSQVIEGLARARQLAGQNNLSAAMDVVFQLIEEAPTYLPLHIQIAELLMQQGRTQDALEKYLMVADLYNLRGETQQAIRLLTRFSQLAPMDVAARQRLIELLGANHQAGKALQQAMELAEVYQTLADFDRARQTYTLALKLAQQSKSSRSLRVKILYKIADIDLQRLEWRPALRVFEQIRTLEPGDVNARRQLANLNFKLGQDAALTEIDGFCALLENAGKRQAAIDFLQEIIAEHVEKIELRKHLAELLARNGQTVQAIEQLGQVADRLVKAGQRQEAIDVLQKIIALKPANIAEYRAALAQLTGQ